MNDFNNTIEGCKHLLAQNIELEHGANPIQNAIWALGPQRRADYLRDQVARHVQSLTLINQTFQNELLLQAKQRSDKALDEGLGGPERRATVTEQLNRHEIPLVVDQRLHEVLKTHQQKHSENFDRFPIMKSLKIVQSNIAAIADARQYSLERYVKTSKAHWLIQRVKSSTSFQQRTNDPFYLDMVSDAEQKILKAYTLANEERHMNQDQALRNANDLWFLIWDPRPVNHDRLVTKIQENEEKILQLSLPPPPGYDSYEMLFFRKGKQGTLLRLASVRVADGVTIPAEKTLDTFKDKCFLLSILSRPQPSSDLERIKLSDQGGSVEYSLYREEDRDNFIWAFTRYKVTATFKGIQWEHKGRLSVKGPFDATAQIWLWDPDNFPTVSQRPRSVLSEESVGRNSIISSRTEVIGVPQSRPRPSTHKSSNTVNGLSEVQIVKKPYKPLLIIFSEGPKGGLIWQIESRSTPSSNLSSLSLLKCGPVHSQMRIDLTRCECREKPRECVFSVIRSESPFQVHIVQPEKGENSNVHFGNIGILGRQKFSGGSRHPVFQKDAKSRKEERVTHKKLTYVQVRFKDVKERCRFNQSFIEALEGRKGDESAQRNIIDKAKRDAETPPQDQARFDVLKHTRAASNPSTMTSGVFTSRIQNGASSSP